MWVSGQAPPAPRAPITPTLPANGKAARPTKAGARISHRGAVSRAGVSSPSKPGARTAVVAYHPTHKISRRAIASMRPQELGSDYLGFSLRNVAKNIGRTVVKAAKDTAKQTVRTGHQAGAVLDNKYVTGALAAGLALTGVGAPAAAAILAAKGLTAGALKEGGGLKESIRRGYQGAATGAVAGVAGSLIHGGAASIISKAGGLAGKGGGLLSTGASKAVGLFHRQKSDDAPADGGGSAEGSAGGSAEDVSTATASPDSPLKRIAAAESADAGSSSTAMAQKVLSIGSAAREKADSISSKISELSEKAQGIEAAALAAKKAGDDSGFAALSQIGGQVAQLAANAANAGKTAAGQVSTAGAAAEGAATGAVVGAGAKGVGDFISENKTVILVGVTGVAALLILPRLMSGGRR